MAEKKEEKKKTPAKKEEKKAEVKKEKPKEEKKKTPEPKKEEPGLKDALKKGTKDALSKEKPKKGEEEKEEKKILKESVHTIPLRKAFDHPKTSRAKYAVREIKRYIRKHTRKEPFVDASVNEVIWARSIQKPPRKIKVKIQEEEKRATAVLP